MRVRAKPAEQLEIPPDIEPYCRQRFITDGKEYEVHAIAAYFSDPCVVFFQIVDDLKYPSWELHILFDIVDHSVAADWCCNIFEDDRTGLILLLGPEFVVKDANSYVGMVEHEADLVDFFWKRIEAIEKAREEQRWLEELDKEQGQSM